MLITVSLITITLHHHRRLHCPPKARTNAVSKCAHATRSRHLVQLVSATLHAAQRAHLLDEASPTPPSGTRDRIHRDRSGQTRRSEPRKRPHGFTHSTFPRGFHVFLVPGTDDRVGVRMPDGALLTARLCPARPSPPLWGGPWIITLLFVIVSITLLGVWAVRALSTPLSAFAKAAESFSLSSEPTPLPGKRSGGDPRCRLGAQPDARTHHHADQGPHPDVRGHRCDLRTPITRLRLRSEFIEDETRTATRCSTIPTRCDRCWTRCCRSCATITPLEPMTLVDQTAILQQIGDQFADLGHKSNT